MADFQSKKDLVFYHLASDATCEFENGEKIGINKTVLALQSSVFMDIFYGSTPKTNLKIDNYDPDTFRTFLDCLLGVRNISLSDALMMQPLAEEYQAVEVVKKCNAVWKSSSNEDVCSALNIAVKRKESADKMINFVKNNVGLIDLIKSDKYSSLLEPVAVIKLIEKLDLNSFLWKIIYKWAENYRKKHSLSVDVVTFFEQNDILSKLEPSHFESVQSILDFQKLTDWKLLDCKSSFGVLENNIFGPKRNFPIKSEWVKNSKTLTETVTFLHSFSGCGGRFKKFFDVEIVANKIFAAAFRNENARLDIKVRYFYRYISSLRGYDCKLEIPRFRYSDYHEISSTDFKEFPEVSACCVRVEVLPDQILEIKSVEITFEFKNFAEFRILKTSLGDKFLNPYDNIYFTRDVIIWSAVDV